MKYAPPIHSIPPWPNLPRTFTKPKHPSTGLPIAFGLGLSRTLLPCTLFRGFGALIPAGPEPSTMSLDTTRNSIIQYVEVPWYIISRRQVHLWVIVRQKRLINGQDMLLINQ